jgi:hypothetical protein
LVLVAEDSFVSFLPKQINGCREEEACYKMLNIIFFAMTATADSLLDTSFPQGTTSSLQVKKKKGKKSHKASGL